MRSSIRACKSSGNCQMVSAGRKHVCAACRYKRCLEMGMSKDCKYEWKLRKSAYLTVHDSTGSLGIMHSEVSWQMGIHELFHIISYCHVISRDKLELSKYSGGLEKLITMQESAAQNAQKKIAKKLAIAARDPNTNL